MAASDNEDFVYAVVSNIPSLYHSSDLRNYFSQFIETSGFKCFHFRHRPQIREFALSDNISTSDTLRTSSTSSTEVNPRTCCIIRVLVSRLHELLNYYNKKHWLDKDGDSLPLKCIINTVKIMPLYSKESQPSYKTRAELKKFSSDECRLEVNIEELQKFQELHPPPAMPNGNVGTPTTVFLELIRTCRLPSKIIGKLGLVFPRNKAKRMYGSVPFDYGEQYKNASTFIPEEEEFIRTASGVILSENMTRNMTQSDQSDICEVEEEYENNSSSDDDDDFCEEWERHEALNNDVTQQNRCKERLFEEKIELKWEKGGSGLVFYTDAQYWDELEGDFDAKTCDDWDVDMNMYYEPNAGDKDAHDMMQMRREKYLRNGQYKLSNLNTDKLSDCTNSGIDFLNVPTPTFSEPMPSTSEIINRKTTRKRKEQSNKRVLKFGGFEQHTKGIGRWILERQGWKEGQGLGKSIVGISEPIEDWGQRPWDKKGLGFRGVKLVRQAKERRRVGRRKGHIGTVYDDPRLTDPPVPVSRSDFHTRLSYRQEFLKAKSS